VQDAEALRRTGEGDVQLGGPARSLRENPLRLHNEDRVELEAFGFAGGQDGDAVEIRDRLLDEFEPAAGGDDPDFAVLHLLRGDLVDVQRLLKF